MKKILFLAMIVMSFSGFTFAGNKDKCTATGVPHLGCVCWSDGECADLGDIGSHP